MSVIVNNGYMTTPAGIGLSGPSSLVLVPIIALKVLLKSLVALDANHIGFEEKHKCLKYFDNHTCYDKILCAVLFSSRW